MQTDKVEEPISILTKIWLDLEPLAVWCKETYTELYEFMLALQRDALANKPMLSVTIKNASNAVVGVALNTEVDIEPEPCSGDPIDCMVIDLDNAYRTYYRANKQTGKVMHAYALGVSNEAKGRGLAGYLLLGTAFLAHQHGYTWCLVEALYFAQS